MPFSTVNTNPILKLDIYQIIKALKNYKKFNGFQRFRENGLSP